MKKYTSVYVKVDKGSIYKGDICYYKGKKGSLYELEDDFGNIEYFRKNEFLERVIYNFSSLEVKSIIRLESKLSEIIKDEYVEIRFDNNIDITLDDLEEAISNFNKLGDESKFDYFYFINRISLNNKLFYDPIVILFNGFKDYVGNGSIDINEALEICKKNINLPYHEMDFTIEMKEQIISYFYNKVENKMELSDDDIKLFDKVLDDLVEIDNKNGLYIKGYLYYGDNPPYKCNYKISLQCLSKLFELDKDIYISNTLGYIHYYPRINNESNYIMAYKYFSYAALAGVSEAVIKISDLYFNGLGVDENPQMALNVLNNILLREEERFYNEEFNKYADILIRFARFYESGKPFELNYNIAYSLYLKALKALSLRNQFGDSSVKNRILKSIDKIIGFVEKPTIDESYDNLYYQLCNNQECNITSKKKKDHYEIIISCKKKRLLANIRNGKCYISNKIKLKIYQDKEIDLNLVGKYKVYFYRNQIQIFNNDEDYELDNIKYKFSVLE